MQKDFLKIIKRDRGQLKDQDRGTRSERIFRWRIYEPI